MNVHFSIRNNGACPLCTRYGSCSIMKGLKDCLLESVKPVHDDTTELVIYRCPEFEDR